MRTDHVIAFNGASETYRQHVGEMIAMKKAELERLEKVFSIIGTIASAEQMVADPTINGDREPLPSIARPPEPQHESVPERRNGRPVIAPQSEQAA